MKIASTMGHSAKAPEIGSCGGAANSWYTMPAAMIAISASPSPAMKMLSGRAARATVTKGAGDSATVSPRFHR